MSDDANKSTPSSRERNRLHARKTRLRKKEHIHSLSAQLTELQEEQLRLKQIINEKRTANILLGLHNIGCSAGETETDTEVRIEALLGRPVEDIPDTPRLAGLLPPLILPGQHASKKTKDVAELDGIDYDLLGKDRSTCSVEELDKIRRERNRMHAKRTRDRKRLFMGELADICKALEEENDLLRAHLREADPDHEECKRELKRTASIAMSTSTAGTTGKKKTKLSFLNSKVMPLAETFTQEVTPDLLPVASPSFSAAEHLDLHASCQPGPSPQSQEERLMFSSLLAAASLDQSSKKHTVSFAVSSDDSNDDELVSHSPCGSKRSRLVEM
jgi:hypothetical protein